MLTITSGHRTIFGRLSDVSGQCNTWPEKMSGQKRTAVDGDLPTAKKAKRGVTTKTVDKWITDNDKTLNTVTWLKYSKSDCEHVATLAIMFCLYPFQRSFTRCQGSFTRRRQELQSGVYRRFNEFTHLLLQGTRGFRHASAADGTAQEEPVHRRSRIRADR